MMALDFTRLDQIQTQNEKRRFSEPLSEGEGKPLASPEKPATGQFERPHSHRLDGEKAERERMREAYRTYQENIKRAGSLRADILKGMERAENPMGLLLKAVECISLMTGDSAIYTQSKANARAVYGWDLGERHSPELASHEAEHTYRR